MEKSFETDNGVSSEEEDNIEDILSCYESEPKLDASSYTNSKADGSDTKPKTKNVSISQEVQEKDGYL